MPQCQVYDSHGCAELSAGFKFNRMRGFDLPPKHRDPTRLKAYPVPDPEGTRDTRMVLEARV